MFQAKRPEQFMFQAKTSEPQKLFLKQCAYAFYNDAQDSWDKVWASLWK